MNGKDIIGGVSPLKQVVKAKRGGKAAKAATKTAKQRGGYGKVTPTTNRGGYNVNTRFKAREAWKAPGSGGSTTKSGTPSAEPSKPYSYMPGGGITINNNPTNINTNTVDKGSGEQTQTQSQSLNQEWVPGTKEEGYWKETDSGSLESYKSVWNRNKDGIQQKYKTLEDFTKAAEEWWASEAGQNYKGKKDREYVITKEATEGYYKTTGGVQSQSQTQKQG